MGRPRVRFLLETAFLVAVALAVALAHASLPVIGATMAIAWAAIAAVEWRVRRREPRVELTERAKRLQRVGVALWSVGLPFLVLTHAHRTPWFVVWLTFWVAGTVFFVASRRANR